MWPCWSRNTTRANDTRPLWGWAVLLALVLLTGPAAPALADGLILDARPAGEAGPQLDAALLSPLPRPRAEPVDGESSYVVQPGDTLAAIAARLEVDMAALAARNGLANPDRLLPGQVLKVRDAGGVVPRLPEHGVLTRVQLWPWPPAQGQTLAVWLQTREPVTLSVRLEDHAYPVVAQGQRGWALIPIPSLTQPGPKTLAVSAGGQTLRIGVPVEAGSFSTDKIPASASAPILSHPDKVQAERQQLAEIFGRITGDGWTARSRFLLPLDGDFPHTSPYGSRRTYGGSTALSAHEGEDFSASAGTPVYAPAAGTVVLAEPLFVRGNAIVLDHGDGVYSGYWHLSELGVKVGDHVVAGQRLGAVGSTGLSTGAHLHWELHIAGEAVDPMQWVGP